MKFLTGLRAVLLVLLSASSADPVEVRRKKPVPDHFDNPIDDRTNVGARYIAVDIKKDLIRRPEHKKSQLMRTPLRRSAARNAESYARVHPDDEATATATTPATTTTPTTTTSTTVSSTRATAATTTTADTLTRTPAKIGAAPTLPALINSGREQAVTEKATLMIDNNNNSGMGTPEAMNSNTVAAVQHDSWLHTPITAKAQEGNTREGYDEMMLAGEGSVAEFTNSTSKGVAIHKPIVALVMLIALV